MNSEKRGGRRPGAGRKPSAVNTVCVSFRIPVPMREELNEFLKENSMNMSAFIKKALSVMK